MKLFIKRLVPILAVLCPIISLAGGALMLVNIGVMHIKLPDVYAGKDLTYNGEYVDLLNCAQQVLLDEGDIRVTLIDQRTGLPAAANMTLVDKQGRESTRDDVVRFTYQGLPAMLQFTDNVVDGFTYLNYLNTAFNSKNNITNPWETDPDLLQEVLNDYASQVSAILS